MAERKLPGRKADAEDWWEPAAGPLPTPRSLLAARRLRLKVRCKACHHQQDADLQRLVDAGRGDVPVRDLRFRCSRCGRRLTERAVALNNNGAKSG
jgi:hypothetical protein